jgi:hypothetical protein
MGLITGGTDTGYTSGEATFGIKRLTTFANTVQSSVVAQFAVASA